MSNPKLKSFNGFILESKICLLLKEGKLVASDNFLSRLKSLTGNKIANTLADAFANNQLIDKNLNYNWIDTTEQDGMITFTSDRNAERANNDPTTIWSSKRQPYSVGKFARAILPDLGYKISGDKEIEEFVNLYKASKIDTSKKFELITGPRIREYYLVDSYAGDTGTLSKSCMRYQKCQDFFKLYSKNSEVCSLLVYLDENNKLLGRALVWKLYKTELKVDSETNYDSNIEYFMDRIYTIHESDNVKFLDYAKKNNWLVKYKMSASREESLQFYHNDKLLFGRIFVNLKRLYFPNYPYVDTLKFADGDTLLSNVGFFVDLQQPDYDLGFILDNTDGMSSQCLKCMGTGHDTDQSGRCIKCKGRKTSLCPTCSGTSIKPCITCASSGREACNKCQRTGAMKCTDCRGQGRFECEKCTGSGSTKCEACDGSGNLGNCEECVGGNKSCTHCNNEPLECEYCDGVGYTLDQLDERINCQHCAGKGSATEGTTRAEGCRCPDCSIGIRGGRWKNVGHFTCDNCQGEGKLSCPLNCNGGNVDCDMCEGEGSHDCSTCEQTGEVACDLCNAEGYVGDCKACNGEGNLGECSCDDGRVPCEVCNSTGVRGRLSEGEYKCSDCAGILDDFIAKKYPEKRIN